jgi:hypothetical protein
LRVISKPNPNHAKTFGDIVLAWFSMPPQPRKKFTLALQQEYLAHMRAGMRRGAAAELLGFSRMTVMDFIEEHPDFEKAVLDAEGQATEHVEEALYQAAVSGNIAAARAWLELKGGYRSHEALRGPQGASGESTGPSEPEDDLFPPNVTRMDPRTRRKGA